MIVWVLIFYMGAPYQGGPALIDNIASADECRRVQKVVLDTTFARMTRCIEVTKVTP